MNVSDSICAACGNPFDPAHHPVSLESPFLMLRVCPGCVEDYIRAHGTPCVNCQGWIVPHSQVAVYKLPHGQTSVAHATVACNPAGNSFYGYWGQGRLAATAPHIEMC